MNITILIAKMYKSISNLHPSIEIKVGECSTLSNRAADQTKIKSQIS